MRGAARTAGRRQSGGPPLVLRAIVGVLGADLRAPASGPGATGRVARRRRRPDAPRGRPTRRAGAGAGERRGRPSPLPALTFYQELTAPLTAPPPPAPKPRRRPAKAPEPRSSRRAGGGPRPRRAASPERATRAGAGPGARFTVQVARLQRASLRPRRCAATLAAAGHDAYVVEIEAGGGVRYRVRVGVFPRARRRAGGDAAGRPSARCRRSSPRAERRRRSPGRVLITEAETAAPHRRARHARSPATTPSRAPDPGRRAPGRLPLHGRSHARHADRADHRLHRRRRATAAGTTSSGQVRLVSDLSMSIEGRHVVIVEDIVDTGLTLTYLKRTLEARHPRSLRVCVLAGQDRAAPGGRRRSTTSASPSPTCSWSATASTTTGSTATCPTWRRWTGTDAGRLARRVNTPVL